MNQQSSSADLGRFAKLGAENFAKIQSPLHHIFEEANRHWIERAKSEAEFASELMAKLVNARSAPDATAIYQEWATQRMQRLAEDSQKFFADSQKVVSAWIKLPSDVGQAAKAANARSQTDCGCPMKSICSSFFVIALIALFTGAAAVQAADITGAWATDVRACDKIFQKKGNVLTLTSRSDTLGGGFISTEPKSAERLRTAISKTKERMEMSSISLRHVRQISCCQMSKWH